MWLWVSVFVGLNHIALVLSNSPGDTYCAIAESQRIDCGYLGIDSALCEARGCCWLPCEDCDADIPWCFLSEEMLEPECQMDNLIDCGFVGITQSECLQRGCCWAPSSLINQPWCFVRDEVLGDTKSTSTAGPAVPTQSPGVEGGVRLADGGDPMQGRVEIYHAGEWGTVCDDSWNDSDAGVVCRQLGYLGGKGYTEGYYGHGEGPIFMDEVQCRGDEKALSACSFAGWGRSDCSHNEDAAVVCSENFLR